MRVGAIEATQEIRWGDARALLGEEGALLARSAEAFRERYGAPLVAVSLPGDPLPSIRFPQAALEQELLLFAPPSFRQAPALIAYLAALGFVVDEGCRVSTVPLPSSFARRRARIGAAGGFTPRLFSLRATLYTAEGWLAYLARGILPINAHGGVAHLLCALAKGLPEPLRLPRPMREKMNNHFFALGHDMGLHALAMHRIPEAPMRELRRLARATLQRSRLDRGGLTRPERVARFFEERLTRSCVEVWAGCERPEGFVPLFEARYPALRAELREIVFGGTHG